MSVLRKGRMTPTKHDWIFDLVENFIQVLYWSRKCETKADYLASVALAYKLLVGKGVMSTAWDFLGSELQEEDTFTKLTRDARDWFTLGCDAISNPLIDKLRLSYTFLLTQGFLEKLGMSIEKEEFLAMDKKYKRKYTDRKMLVVTMLDTAITICERIDAYRLTGDWKSFIHDDAHYTQWIKTADRLITLAPFTSNLAAHGTTYFEFIADLNDAVEKGEAFCKYSAKHSGVEALSMRKKLNSLQLLKNVEVTRRASQKERKAPFGVLIHGASSVGKSSFTKMLYYYYGQIHGLETDDHFRYVRNPADEYWSNFDSSKWCIQMDDIAFLLSQKAPEADPTLMEMLNVVNNVPYVPPQAALEDKGKTPVIAKLVLATSNAPDLNAQDYFHCPLAVRRRLPFVVQVEPKDEYLHPNGKFLDPTRLPKEHKGFPDFWKITVQKLVPVDHNGRDSARLETVQVYTDVREFLKAFGVASREHEENQNNSSAYDLYMKDIKVCSLCYSVKEDCKCLQALYVPVWSLFIWKWVAAQFGAWLFWFFTSMMATSVGILFSQYIVFRYSWLVVARWMSTEHEIRIHGLFNSTRNFRFKYTMGQIVKVGALVAQFYVMYKCASYVLPSSAKVTEKEEQERSEKTVSSSTEEEITIVAYESVSRVSVSVDPSVPVEKKPHAFDPQGNILGTTESQLRKEEAQNVWYNPTLELSKFDVPLAARSLSNLQPSQVRDLVAHNCVTLEIHAMDVAFAIRLRGIFLKGQYLCFNRHGVRKGSRFRMSIICGTQSQGLTPNCDVYFSRSEVKEIVEKDIVVLRVANMPPRKDILKYWNNTQLPVTHIVSVHKDRDGQTSYNELFNAIVYKNFPIETLGVSTDVYMATGSQITQEGDCGSVGIALTPQGPVILGLHTLGCRGTAVFPHVTRDALGALCDSGIGAIEGVGEPQLTLNGENIVVPPHHKSVFRYLDRGHANVYGSLPGFRPRPRSKVKATPLQQEVMEHFGCKVAHGPPVMDGWEPVYNNVSEMVKPFTNVDQQLLDLCVESYAQDIISGLDQKHGLDWRGELVFLSDKAAVNGLPGVKFIDRLNVSTSMGHPWNKSKKQFLFDEPDEVYPAGVNFEPQVWERVRKIEEKYAAGQRAYPVFTAHLKDEAITKAKIEKKKTRLFTGGPVDWSIVVRSRLLSFVRLLQKNKLIFEAAPGTVAQSVEWTHFYEYLTKFGDDRIVAGDYGKFDKHMIATFVLSAYKVIGRIHQAAGFSDEEIRQIHCIGNDTAFPLTNVSGDLIEFYGTNPSGHPLTVIVNSIVNSLYMRYAYCRLNPNGLECKTFKQNVNLLTYGDDNIMGVNRECDWFNHTAIQRAMNQIGVEYTMADKEAKSLPFISIKDCSFLKRKWRFEQELGMFVCPLEEASIHRSLTVWVPSGTVDQYKQMVDVITSANNEYFFYGRSIFEKHHRFFQDLLAISPYSHYVNESTLPSWDDLIDRFRRASEAIIKSQ